MASVLHTRRARRVVLVCLVGVAVATIASYVGHRQAARTETATPAAMADDIRQQTQRFSLSRTLENQTVYTIQAEQVTNYEDTGKMLLSGVTVLIYGKDGSRRDSLSTRECVYDPAAGSLWVPGQVEMQFDVPLEAATHQTGAPPDRPPSLSLITSQLSFEQSTGIATTSAPVRFAFDQGEGSAHGAVYDPKEQTVVLQSQVDVTFRDPEAGASAPQSHVEAGTAHFARETDMSHRLLLEGGVVLSQDGRQTRAARGEIMLDDRYRAREALLEGDVVATQQTSDLSGEVRAARADFRFNDRGHVLSLAMTGDMLHLVRWKTQSVGEQRSGEQRREGEARHLTLSFSDATGVLERIVAEEAVRAEFRSERPGAQSAGQKLETQTVTGERAVVTMNSDGKAARQAEISTSARFVIEPREPQSGRRTVTAERFDIAFDARGSISTFRASDKVVMHAEDAAGPRRSSRAGATPAAQQERRSSSDSMEAAFHPETGEVDRLRQWGHFKYQDEERQASAAEAEYGMRGKRIVLQGKPAVWNSEGRLTAATIELNTATNGLTAEGDVRSTFAAKPQPGSSPQEPLHVVADRLDYDAAAKRSHFNGRSRLWQGEGFLVEASSLEWSPEQGNLLARDKVYSVFRQTPEPNGANSKDGKAAGPKQPVVIRAGSLRFERPRWLAHYEDAVAMQSGAGKVTASQLDIFLQPAGSEEKSDLSLSAGRIQRAVAEGAVTFAENGRVATGDRADYLPSREEVQLFGAPAAISDPAKGRVEGSKLTYHLGDDSIRVEGKPGVPTDTRWRVP